MYLIGKVKRVIDIDTVAWEAVRICMTRRAAEKHCVTAGFFYIKIGFKPLKTDAKAVHPRLEE